MIETVQDSAVLIGMWLLNVLVCYFSFFVDTVFDIANICFTFDCIWPMLL